jgi:hypothetical protein
MVQARQLAMFFAKKIYKASLANIVVHNRDRGQMLLFYMLVKQLIIFVATDKQFKIC